ncbi:MAG: amino acid ABC transporter substrate-binding protein [Chitinophagaceae bacterium]
MKRKLLLFTVYIFTFLFAQTQQKHKIAVFAPLYLDSAYDASGNYKLGNSFPKYAISGLEFYEGAQAAFDSLNKQNAQLEVYIYDTRAGNASLKQQINSNELKDVELIIVNGNASDIHVLADAAKTKKVPLISATLPNDAGVINNPYFVVLNATLRTHCEGIYYYIQKYHPLDRIVLFTKTGSQEEQVKKYFREIAQTSSGTPLKIDIIDIGNGITADALKGRLDIVHKNVCISGSLDETFGASLAQQLSSLGKKYGIKLIGMPTWDNLNFSRPEYKNLEVVYSTPFNYDRSDKSIAKAAKEFEAKVNGRPTEMYFRGYETALRFSLLLLDTKKDIASNLTRKGNTVFTLFDIQPVFLDKKNMTLDYFENKHLYFVKVVGGARTVQY